MTAPVPDELARGWLTPEVPPLPGRLRERPEDFRVEEVPLYLPCGEGEHLYLTVEKTGLSTDEAIRRIGRALGVPRARIGHAGLKDARAVTVQTLSVQGAPPDAARRLEGLEGLRVLDARPHRNKLKVGHLAGNRFRLRLAGAGAHADAARAALAALAARGAAAYFGLQRYGRERSTHRLGEALVREDARAFLDLLLLGPPGAEAAGAGGAEDGGAEDGGAEGGGAEAGGAADGGTEDGGAEGGGAEGGGAEAGGAEGGAARPRGGGRVAEARARYRAGDLEGAARALPRALQAEHAALRALAQGRSAEAAVKAIPSRWRSFYVAAFQAWLFDGYLDRRLARLDRLEAGEVATLHRNGASFLVEDAAAEQPRCDAFELSPSGPMFGAKLLRPRDGSQARADEEAVLAARAPGLGAELGPALGARPQGERRPLRVPVREVEVAADGDDLRVAFLLPRGCYATSVLEELLKRRLD